MPTPISCRLLLPTSSAPDSASRCMQGASPVAGLSLCICRQQYTSSALCSTRAGLVMPLLAQKDSLHPGSALNCGQPLHAGHKAHPRPDIEHLMSHCLLEHAPALHSDALCSGYPAAGRQDSRHWPVSVHDKYCRCAPYNGSPMSPPHKSPQSRVVVKVSGTDGLQMLCLLLLGMAKRRCRR